MADVSESWLCSLCAAGVEVDDVKCHTGNTAAVQGNKKTVFTNVASLISHNCPVKLTKTRLQLEQPARWFVRWLELNFCFPCHTTRFLMYWRWIRFFFVFFYHFKRTRCLKSNSSTPLSIPAKSQKVSSFSEMQSLLLPSVFISKWCVGEVST